MGLRSTAVIVLALKAGPIFVVMCMLANAAEVGIKGCVKDEYGKPAVKYPVNITNLDVARTARVFTNSKGCYSKFGLPSGTYTLFFAWPGDHPRPAGLAEADVAAFRSPNFVPRGSVTRKDFSFQQAIAEMRSVRRPNVNRSEVPDPLTGGPPTGLDSVDWAKPETVTQNIEAWRALAQAGNAEWQYRLGILYDSGRGVQRDQSQAFQWFLKAAEQGYTSSLTVVGLQYLYGRGIAADRDKALYWLRKSATQGEASAMWALGVMYAEGRNVTQDFIQGHMWFNLAASQGWKIAADARDRLAARMTPDQIASAQKLASEWGSTPKAESKPPFE